MDPRSGGYQEFLSSGLRGRCAVPLARNPGGLRLSIPDGAPQTAWEPQRQLVPMERNFRSRPPSVSGCPTSWPPIKVPVTGTRITFRGEAALNSFWACACTTRSFRWRVMDARLLANCAKDVMVAAGTGVDTLMVAVVDPELEATGWAVDPPHVATAPGAPGRGIWHIPPCSCAGVGARPPWLGGAIKGTVCRGGQRKLGLQQGVGNGSGVPGGRAAQPHPQLRRRGSAVAQYRVRPRVPKWDFSRASTTRAARSRAGVPWSSGSSGKPRGVPSTWLMVGLTN